MTTPQATAGHNNFYVYCHITHPLSFLSWRKSLHRMLTPRRTFHWSSLLISGALLCFSAFAKDAPSKGWRADNGNGTFTNPLFYEEFSDPDLIRVGADFYMTGTTMHTMPGLPVLHSRDLVNWQLLTYACDRLDLGPEYRLEGGEIYGQGIWAPCLRYHDGTFYIFTNVNHRKTQVFIARNPAGPWTRSEMRVSLHDLSVLFDDNGKIFAVWGYDEIMMAELLPDLSDIKPDTRRIIIPKGKRMGEGSHFYKIDGHYYILSANYDPMGYMVCARSDRAEGPYEVGVVSARETLGNGIGWRLRGQGHPSGKLELAPPRPSQAGAISLHQGGIVDTPGGEWWGFSMMDHNSVGRVTCLSPVTWTDGWPYFGLPGNLTRTPQTWLKPKVDESVAPSSPFEHSDDFSAAELQPIWQWNHVPDPTKWSLTQKPGTLSIQATSAKDFFHARNTLTQRAVGPESIASVRVDATRLEIGDVAGLGLLNLPYAWLGLRRDEQQFTLVCYNQLTGETQTVALVTPVATLRVQCDFDREAAQFSYSSDGQTFTAIGGEVTTVFQLKTFQGVRFALFSYTEKSSEGGWAGFDDFMVQEPRASGPSRGVPIGQVITFTSVADNTRLVAWRGALRAVPLDSAAASSAAANFRVHDRRNGRVALSVEDGSGFVAVFGLGAAGDVRLVKEENGNATTFQWQDMLRHDAMLMSLTNHRYLRAWPHSGELLSADSPGADPDRKEGSCFIWAPAHVP